jgi:hypothetical protein
MRISMNYLTTFLKKNPYKGLLYRLGIKTHSDLKCGKGFISEFRYNIYQRREEQEQEELSLYEDSLLVNESPHEDINSSEVVEDALDEQIYELLHRLGVIKDNFQFRSKISESRDET